MQLTDADKSVAIPVQIKRNSGAVQCHRNVQFSALKHSTPLQHGSDFRASRVVQDKQIKKIGTVNSMEKFEGYVKHTINQLLRLKAVAKISFEVVPAAQYSLGTSDLTSKFSLLSIGGTVDKSSRLDRRTNYWLCTQASEFVQGIEYRDGPQHFVYRTARRTSFVPTYYVSTTPMTIEQFMMLKADRRYSAKLEHLVHSAWLSHEFRNEATGVFSHKELESVAVAENITREDGDNRLLEVPYFVAQEICRAIGGFVCPVDVWEAASTGVEAREFLISEEIFQKMDFFRTAWCLDVPEESREVYGTSWRVSPKSIPLLSSVQSPFQLKWMNGLHSEWNSCVTYHLPEDAPQPSSSTTMENHDTDEDQQETLVPSTKKMSELAPLRKPAPPPLSALRLLQMKQQLEAERLEQRNVDDGVPATVVCHPPADPWFDAEVVQPTTHVLRSACDLNTQTVFRGTCMKERSDQSTFEQNATSNTENYKGYVGFGSHCFATPHHGIPVAAFRVAIPAFVEDRDRLLRKVAALQEMCGGALTFAEVIEFIGAPRVAIPYLRGIHFDVEKIDSVYGSSCLTFSSIGLDLVFLSSTPPILHEIVLFQFHSSQKLSALERTTCTFKISSIKVSDYSIGSLCTRIAIDSKKQEVRFLAHQIALDRQLDHAAFIASKKMTQEMKPEVEALRQVRVVTDDYFEFAYVDQYRSKDSGRGGRSVLLLFRWTLMDVTTKDGTVEQIVSRISVTQAPVG